jgi:hypothetical protein
LEKVPLKSALTELDGSTLPAQFVEFPQVELLVLCHAEVVCALACGHAASSNNAVKDRARACADAAKWVAQRRAALRELGKSEVCGDEFGISCWGRFGRLRKIFSQAKLSDSFDQS